MFSRFTAAVLVTALLAVVPSSAQAHDFTDVPGGHTFAAEIAWLASTGVTTGYDEPDGTTTFRPSQPVLREQMAAFLYRIDHRGANPDPDTTAPSGFLDVAASHVFKGHIKWLADTGISTGYITMGGYDFRPGQPVLREQMAAFLYRLNGATATATSCGFVDLPASHTFAREICWLKSTGITTGYAEPGGATTFRGSDPVLREQMAAFLHRYAVRYGGWGTTTRVSVRTDGTQATLYSSRSSVSHDGRYVAFSSRAALINGDTNDVSDIFVRDTQAGTTTRVSLGRYTDGNGASDWPAISADGRYVAFQSVATNLVPGDTNGTQDIFVRDTQTGTTTRVSVDSAGAQADHLSEWPSISADGRYVVFSSRATNLVAGDTNGWADIFVHDRQTGVTTRVSVATGGAQGEASSSSPKISADGRYVSFTSYSATLVAGDTNGERDAFVHDRQTGTTERVSVAGGGAQAAAGGDAGSVSADGRYVGFSTASSLVPADTDTLSDAYVRDRHTGTTHLVSVSAEGVVAGAYASPPSLSADGRYAVFTSTAANLVPGDTNDVNDAFVHDRQTGATLRVSIATDGTQADRDTLWAVLSGDGRFVAMTSNARTLVADDTNSTTDIFLHDRGPI